MDQYRLYKRYVNGGKQLFISIKKLPVDPNDQIHDFEFEKLFDFSEDEELFNCFRETISSLKRKKNYILTLDIDPKLPASIKKGIKDVRIQTERKRGRKAANTPEVYKKETLDTPTKLRTSIRTQPDENRWFIGIDQCYREDIAADEHYEYRYFDDYPSLFAYLRNDVIPIIKKFHYEPLITVGTDSPKSLSEKVGELVKEIKDGKFDVIRESDEESKEEPKVEEGSFLKRIQKGCSLTSLLDDL